jgi:F-type H+-transporting ATPase subunit b
MEGLQISDILYHILNILVLFWLLRLILYKPVSRFMTQRTERIESGLRDAESKQKEALELKAQYENVLESSEEKGQELIRESQAKASREAEIILADARDRADRMIQSAKAQIEDEKNKAIAEARSEVAQLAVQIAARILRREVSSVDNTAAVEGFFHEAR